MSPADLTELLSKILEKSTGRPRSHWRRTLGRMKTYPLSTHPSCNWSLEPTGSIADVEMAQKALDQVRSEHPFVARQD